MTRSDRGFIAQDMDPELESDLNVLVSGLGKFEADKDGGEDVFQRTIDTLGASLRLYSRDTALLHKDNLTVA